MRKPNPYANVGLNRVSERRGDRDWLESLLRADETLVLPMWRSRNLVIRGDDAHAVVLRGGEARGLFEVAKEVVLLGLKGDVAHFAVDLSHIDEPHGHAPLPNEAEFVDLRSVSVMLPRDVGGLLAYAKGMLHWHQRHLFCGVCGSPTKSREAGFVRVCTNPDCGTHHFPRTDPAVIMLISRGDRAVLGRKAEWPEHMYSTLAGFVEPGESLEDAVAREVMEEVGIAITNIRYHSSQPWPFPSSLMLGYYADALSDEIVMNPDELEDARWFTRAELAEGGAGIKHRPRSDSIARRLIEEWVNEG